MHPEARLFISRAGGRSPGRSSGVRQARSRRIRRGSDRWKPNGETPARITRG